MRPGGSPAHIVTPSDAGGSLTSSAVTILLVEVVFYRHGLWRTSWRKRAFGNH
jgi:hypothetical protein